MGLLVSYAPGEHQVADVPALVRDFRIVAHGFEGKERRYSLWMSLHGDIFAEPGYREVFERVIGRNMLECLVPWKQVGSLSHK